MDLFSKSLKLRELNSSFNTFVHGLDVVVFTLFPLPRDDPAPDAIEAICRTLGG